MGEYPLKTLLKGEESSVIDNFLTFFIGKLSFAKIVVKLIQNSRIGMPAHRL